MFQPAPKTDAEIAASQPLELTPEQVQELSEHEWYAQAYQGDKPQLTLRAVLMGTVLGFFLSFTNIYIGLKTGWFLGVALTACILSYAFWNILRAVGVAKTPMTILENNCMQSTASSAGYATGNMLVSAVPAMLMLSVTPENPLGTQLSPTIIGAWVFFVAILGVTLAIPFKRTLINRDKLKFPSGTAAAVTLRGIYSKGEEAMAKARALGIAAGVGALLKVLTDLRFRVVTGEDGKRAREALLPDSSNVFDWIKGFLPEGLKQKMHIFHAGGKEWTFSDWTLRMDHSAVLIAAGAIVGLRTCASMVASGLVLAFVIGPHGMDSPWQNALGQVVTAVKRPGAAWKEIGLWLGAPMIVAYSLAAFAAQWRTIARAFGGLRRVSADDKEDAKSAADPNTVDSKTVEVPTTWFMSGLGVASAGIAILGWRFFQIPPVYGLLAVAMTFILGLVSCRSTGETDITPGGAMGKIMQLTYGVLIPQSTTANLTTASITSGAGLAAADLLNDLKSGYLLGANPRRQFLAQAAGIVTGTVASVLGYFLLVPDASKLTGDHPEFAAPGAQQWKAAAELFMHGVGNLHPMARTLIVWGLALGILLAALESWFPKIKKWMPSATGLGLGLILPFSAPLAFLVGAIMAEIAAKVNKSWAERFIVPIAAGTIAGESIIGVIVATLNNFVFL